MEWRRVGTLVFALLAALACDAGGGAGPGPPTLRVFAAASATDVIGALATRFEGLRVVPSFGASSELARQIRDGAPADVFVSASRSWMDDLARAGRLEGAPVVIARGELVAVAPRGSPLAREPVEDARALLSALGADGRVAIADAGVPAGEYARQALAHAGLAEPFAPHLVGQKDVRAVLHAVEQGELDAGFVYASDARGARVAALFTFPPGSHDPVEMLAAAVRGAADPVAARRFVAFLRGPEARRAFEAAGFTPP